MLLHGIFAPITTPFYPDGNVYFKKLESNVERYSRSPCAGIVVLGSTGEAILLSDQERRDVLKSAREAAAPNKVLIAGTGIESAIDTLRLTEYAAELGYDVAMVRTPHYYKKQMQPANILGVLPHRGRSLAAASDHLQLSAGHRLRHSGRTRN
jgi:4-hydroxy-2-oxoglutarate aldolase